MINPGFFESNELYKKHKYDAPETIAALQKEFPPLSLNCNSCRKHQTFTVSGSTNDQNIVKMSTKQRLAGSEIYGSVNVVWYLCASCQSFGYSFLFRISDENDAIMKVGQYPTSLSSPSLQ